MDRNTKKEEERGKKRRKERKEHKSECVWERWMKRPRGIVVLIHLYQIAESENPGILIVSNHN